jgi:putative acetyltransferase
MKCETERLILRNFSRGDLDDFYEYAKNPDVGPNAGWEPHKSKAYSKKVMKEQFLGNAHAFGIVLRETGKLIGSIGLVEDRKRQNLGAMMMGYALGEPYWGRGFMTEAARAVLQYGFADLELKLVSAYCYPHNARSRNVMEKLGMSYEGTLRQSDMLYDGRVLDNLCFSITRAEYFENKVNRL